ncbi:MAG: glutathione S-transferase N-terminal domain-containing protein [Chloroflexi bacterium]|nr:glutathione S-transferase N-terminal domain-containing protein [Chloroflexota bacterium]
MQNESQIVIYATQWCPDCLRVRRLLDEMKIEYKLIDINQDERGKEYVMRVNHGNKSVPTILFPDGSILVEPSNSILSQKINRLKTDAENNVIDQS